MEYVVCHLAEKWGVPPWDVDISGPPCGHGSGCPRNARWIHYQLELMRLESIYANA